MVHHLLSGQQNCSTNNLCVLLPSFLLNCFFDQIFAGADMYNPADKCFEW